MQQSKKIGLVWFTTNLRITDNEALYNACMACDHVIGLYVFNPKHFQPFFKTYKKTSPFRAQFLRETVQDLKENLKSLNISLCVAHTAPEEALNTVITEYQPQVIYTQNQWFFEECQPLNYLRQNTEIPIITYNDQCLMAPQQYLDDTFPKTFTQFRKRIEKYQPALPLKPQPMPLANLCTVTDQLPTMAQLGLPEPEQTLPNNAFPFKGGETAAKARLNEYLYQKHILTYKETRNGLIGLNYSSKLSAWLAIGALSPKYIYHKIKIFEKEVTKNQSTYWLIFELYWREFFKHLGQHFGDQIFKLEGIKHRLYNWHQDAQLFNSWVKGQTPEPFVNANMIELAQTGWMSNRGRQICASYLTKHLGIDWRWGARYFESQLIDYDPDNNYGNWMYLAGVGNDPRDRVFNVKLQQEKYDPQFKYINIWLKQIPS